ncbi:hypothetical protein CMT41_16410 [Colwellia sp. MT41]|uniref:hypothetical protein n=1 Tax=Colwellia sp. MT41 TaxID=58049 RepID=UPI0007178E49|nr:hypothetical protein [Colwellia sp. MT41]ALO36136.1 hypothetical protein CMT41_16410 [Colwellia sp. MT41]
MKHLLTTSKRSLIEIEGKGGKTTITVKSSTSGAIAGAKVGGLIGIRFGPQGIIAGTIIGGITGFIFGEED